MKKFKEEDGASKKPTSHLERARQIALQKAMTPSVSFDPTELPANWRCSCNKVRYGWCEHLQSYWGDGRDSEDIRILLATGGINRQHVMYVLPGGQVQVPLSIVPVKPEDIGLDEGPLMYRMSYYDHLSLWMEDDTAGHHVIDQLIDIVKSAGASEQWIRRSLSGMGEFDKCHNKYHSPGDSRTFNQVLGMLLKESHEASRRYVFANAFNDHFNGRCIPCKVFSEQMMNDVPSGFITGKATAANPF